MNGTLILTSDGLTTDRMIQEVTKTAGSDISKKSVAIVTTASRDKEENPYSIRAKEQYQHMGFEKVMFADLESQPDFDYSSYNLIHVCGGNTFKLLHYARLCRFKEAVENLLNRDGIYV